MSDGAESTPTNEAIAAFLATVARLLDELDEFWPTLEDAPNRNPRERLRVLVRQTLEDPSLPREDAVEFVRLHKTLEEILDVAAFHRSEDTGH